MHARRRCEVATSPSREELRRLADEHAREAERLLAGRLGIITNYVKAQAHASLAVYYESLLTENGR
jgi:hypothetical protein